VTQQSDLARRNARTAITAIAVVVGMVGLSFAFVPLYTLICQVTGLGGTPQRADAAGPVVLDREITVRFDANVDQGLPWAFKPDERTITLRLGEERLMSYSASNLAGEPVTGISTFNVTPLKAAQYFTKIECFCFVEQTLAPGQTAHMPVTFFVDPALADDDLANEVKTITLSYTFYKSLDDIPLEDEEDAVSSIQPPSNSKVSAAFVGGN
jgi:cytochrome c oxidase assembly protein subunit 11